MIIGICGKARSGKDYLANILLNKFQNIGISANIYHFADYLKNILCLTFDITLDELNELKISNQKFQIGNSSLTMRQILQNFGTNAMRHYDDFFFINYTINKIISDNSQISIIADVRFQNELDILITYKSFLVKIHYQNGNEHLSEIEQNSFNDQLFDHNIYNENHEADFDSEANNILNKMGYH